MLIGKETGIGPALRVLRHFTEREPFYQIKFQSGESALLLAADMPAPSVELVRLALGGLVPWQIVWEYNPMRAGGYSDYIHKLKAMFSSTTERPDDTAHHIRDMLLSCRSIEDARVLLLQRERLANSSNNDMADDFTRSKPRSVTSNDGWTLGMSSPHRAPVPEGINPQYIRTTASGVMAKLNGLSTRTWIGLSPLRFRIAITSDKRARHEYSHAWKRPR